MDSHSGPSSFNFVTFLLLVAAAAATYWVWLYFPHYYNAVKVKDELAKEANQVYKMNIVREPDRTLELRKIVETTKNNVRTITGTLDPNLEIELDLDGDDANLSADWTMEIHHLGNKVSRLHFHRMYKFDLKLIQWD